MPQLPSGKHIALDPSPLQNIITEAYEGLKVHELMAIENTPQLFSHIKVLYFRPTEESSSMSLAAFSIVPPDGLEPYDSGYNLASIKNEVETWGNSDQKAFIDFLNETRTNRFLEELLEIVSKYQEQLTDQPTTLQGMIALWWKLGIHPLQEENDND